MRYALCAIRPRAGRRSARPAAAISDALPIALEAPAASLDALAGAAGVLAALAVFIGAQRLCARCAREQQRALRDDEGLLLLPRSRQPHHHYYHPHPLLSSGLPGGWR